MFLISRFIHGPSIAGFHFIHASWTCDWCPWSMNREIDAASPSLSPATENHYFFLRFLSHRGEEEAASCRPMDESLDESSIICFSLLGDDSSETLHPLDDISSKEKKKRKDKLYLDCKHINFVFLFFFSFSLRRSQPGLIPVEWLSTSFLFHRLLTHGWGRWRKRKLNIEFH